MATLAEPIRAESVEWWHNLDLRVTEYRDQWFAERTSRELVPSADRQEASRSDALTAAARDLVQLYGAAQSNANGMDDLAMTGGQDLTEMMDQLFIEV